MTGGWWIEPLYSRWQKYLCWWALCCAKEEEWWAPSFVFVRWNIAFWAGMYNFIDYKFCLMTVCRTDISGFSSAVIYGLVREGLICSVCADVSAVVTCSKKPQWSIALWCCSWQICGSKAKGLCSGAAMTSRDSLVINLWFLIVTNAQSPLCCQSCPEQED